MLIQSKYSTTCIIWRIPNAIILTCTFTYLIPFTFAHPIPFGIRICDTCHNDTWCSWHLHTKNDTIHINIHNTIRMHISDKIDITYMIHSHTIMHYTNKIQNDTWTFTHQTPDTINIQRPHTVHFTICMIPFTFRNLIQFTLQYAWYHSHMHASCNSNLNSNSNSHIIHIQNHVHTTIQFTFWHRHTPDTIQIQIRILIPFKFRFRYLIPITFLPSTEFLIGTASLRLWWSWERREGAEIPPPCKM